MRRLGGAGGPWVVAVVMDGQVHVAVPLSHCFVRLFVCFPHLFTPHHAATSGSEK